MKLLLQLGKISLVLLLLSFTEGFMENASAPQEKEIINNFKDQKKSETVPLALCIASFDNMTQELDNFILNFNCSLSEVIRNCVANKYLDNYVDLLTCNFEKKYPQFCTDLDVFFSKGDCCQWIYVYSKNKPFYGLYFYKLEEGETRYNRKKWSYNTWLFEGEHKFQWLVNIIKDNVCLGDGYIWYNKEKVLVRKINHKGKNELEFIYVFGFSTPPYYYKIAPPQIYESEGTKLLENK